MTVDEEQHEDLVRQDAVPVFVRFLRMGDDSTKVQAATALGNFINSGYNKEIAAADGIQPLIQLAEYRDEDVRKAATKALLNMTETKEGRRLLAEAGGNRLFSMELLRGLDALGLHEASVGHDDTKENGDGMDRLLGSSAAQLLETASSVGSTPAADASFTTSDLLDSVSDQELMDGGKMMRMISKLGVGDATTKVSAVRELHSHCDLATAQKLVAAGAIPALVAMLGDDITAVDAAGLLDTAAALDGCVRDEILQADGLATLVELLHEGASNVVPSAIQVVNKILGHAGARDGPARVGTIESVVSLASAVGGDGSDGDMRDRALSALKRLAAHGANRTTIIQAGGCRILVPLMRDGGATQRVKATRALESLLLASADEIQPYRSDRILGLLALVLWANDGDLTDKAASVLQGLIANPFGQAILPNENNESVPTEALTSTSESTTTHVRRILLSLLGAEGTEAIRTDPNAIPALVTLVRRGHDDLKTIAVNELRDLALDSACQVKIIAGGGVAPLSALVQNDNSVQKTSAACALGRVLVGQPQRVTVQKVAATGALTRLLATGTDEQKDEVVGALRWLAEFPRYRDAIVEAGGVDLLRDSLDHSVQRATDAIEVLIHVAKQGVDQFSTTKSWVPRIVEMLKLPSEEFLKTRALFLLRVMSRSQPNAAEFVECDGVPAALALVRDGNGDQRSEALLTLLNVTPTSAGREAIKAANGIQLLASVERNDKDATRKRNMNAKRILASFTRDQDEQQRVPPSVTVVVRNEGMDVSDLVDSSNLAGGIAQEATRDEASAASTARDSGSQRAPKKRKIGEARACFT